MVRCFDRHANKFEFVWPAPGQRAARVVARLVSELKKPPQSGGFSVWAVEDSNL
jgi:hypothetical protein